MAKRITCRYVTLRDKLMDVTQENALKQLFDAEYAKEYGKWTRYEPYGYSSFDVRVLAYHHDKIVGHVAAQRRIIQVGTQRVVVAGIGGMLVAPAYRKHGIARRMLVRLQEAIRTVLFADFGYLGCREEVVPFYTACGFRRLYTTETSVNRLTRKTVTATHTPIMVGSGLRPPAAFPDGPIDLNGTPW